MSNSTTRCPSCGTEFEIEADRSGRENICPVCGKHFFTQETPIPVKAAPSAPPVRLLRPAPGIVKPAPVKLTVPSLSAAKPQKVKLVSPVPAADRPQEAPTDRPPEDPAGRPVPDPPEKPDNMKALREKIARFWKQWRGYIIAGVLVLFAGGLLWLGVSQWRAYTARKAREEKLRQEEIARKAREEKLRREEAARKAEEEKFRQEEAERLARRRKRQEAEAAQKAQEKQEWQERRERFWNEYETERRQKASDKVFIWSTRTPDATILIFRYDKEFGTLINALLVFRNHLLQYNRMVSGAVAAYQEHDYSAVMDTARKWDPDSENIIDSIGKMIREPAGEIFELVIQKNLLVRQATLDNSEQLGIELPKGKYLIVRLTEQENSIGHIFHKWEEQPLFLEADEQKWFDRTVGYDPAANAARELREEQAAREAALQADLRKKRRGMLARLKELIRTDPARIPALEQSFKLDEDPGFRQRHERLQLLLRLQAKDKAAIAELAEKYQWRIGQHDLRTACSVCRGTGKEPCSHCKNTGVCRLCKGTGVRTTYETVSEGQKLESVAKEVECPKECTHCDGQKKPCSRCHGKTGSLNLKAVRTAIQKERADFCWWADAQIARIDQADGIAVLPRLKELIRTDPDKASVLAQALKLDEDPEFRPRHERFQLLLRLEDKDETALAELAEKHRWHIGEFDLRTVCSKCRGTGKEPCSYCKNTGICHLCKGTGVRTTYETVSEGKTLESVAKEVECPKECANCDGQKKPCSRCHGKTGSLNLKAVRTAIQKERANFCSWVDAKTSERDTQDHKQP